MRAPKIGVAVQSVRRPLRAALELASRSQAEGVELDLRSGLPPSELTPSAVRQLRKLLEDLRLAAAAAAFPTRRGFAVAEGLDRRLAATAAAIKSAAQIGAKVIVLQPGALPEEDLPQRSTLVDSLTLLARQGEHFGVQIALLANGDSLDQLPGLLAQLPPHTLGACFDPAALLSDGHSAGDALAKLGPWLAHLHASDAVCDLSARGAVTVELGRGSVDWPELLARLEEFDYHGWAMVKLREGGDPQEVENAVTYLRAVGL